MKRLLACLFLIYPCASSQADNADTPKPAVLTGSINEVFRSDNLLFVSFQVENNSDEPVWLFRESGNIEIFLDPTGRDLWISAKKIHIPVTISVFFPAALYSNIPARSSQHFALAFKLPVKERAVFADVRKRRKLNPDKLKRVSLFLGYIRGSIADGVVEDWTMETKPAKATENLLNIHWISEHGEYLTHLEKIGNFDLKVTNTSVLDGYKAALISTENPSKRRDIFLFPVALAKSILSLDAQKQP